MTEPEAPLIVEPAAPIITATTMSSATGPEPRPTDRHPAAPPDFLSAVAAAVLAALLASAGTLAIVMGTVMPRLQALEAATTLRLRPPPRPPPLRDATAASIVTVDEQSITGIVTRAR